MSEDQKLLPRNATAWNTERVVGNPVSSRLEASVGNCFPGLDVDVRNIDRRFFPFLLVDFYGGTMLIVSVDLDAAREAGIDGQQLALYETIAEFTNNSDPDDFWYVEAIEGSFGHFGRQSINRMDFRASPPRTDIPSDIWTAVRLIPEDDEIVLTVVREPAETPPQTHQLRQRRQSYLNNDGALNPIFQPGELTQSLCSPWTHDFRDCGCYYWASNHPDIAQPLRPEGAEPQQAFDAQVSWQRSERGGINAPPEPAVWDQPAEEMTYYEINHRWEDLPFLAEGREQASTYKPREFSAEPFATVAELVSQVRYAAGVELAVTLEYLSAAYSINRSAAGGTLADDVEAAFYEVMRIATGEMKHIRAVNDMLRAFHERGLVDSFSPALQVASELPIDNSTTRPLAFRSLTLDTLDDFIDIERPSFSVDGLYGRILSTVREFAPGPLEELVSSIMADGTDHFETFNFIKEWLGRHDPEMYLLPLQDPEEEDERHLKLQASYHGLLNQLHTAYQTGLPGGATLIAESQANMLRRPDGLRGLCEALASDNLRVRFTPPLGDPRFEPIGKPVSAPAIPA